MVYYKRFSEPAIDPLTYGMVARYTLPDQDSLDANRTFQILPDYQISEEGKETYTHVVAEYQEYKDVGGNVVDDFGEALPESAVYNRNGGIGFGYSSTTYGNPKMDSVRDATHMFTIIYCTIPENMELFGGVSTTPNGLDATAPVAEYDITGNTAVNPTVVTTDEAHGMSNGGLVIIDGSNSNPSIDGVHQVANVLSHSFTIDVNVNSAGNAGKVIASNVAANGEFRVTRRNDVSTVQASRLYTLDGSSNEVPAKCVGLVQYQSGVGENQFIILSHVEGDQQKDLLETVNVGHDLFEAIGYDSPSGTPNYKEGNGVTIRVTGQGYPANTLGITRTKHLDLKGQTNQETIRKTIASVLTTGTEDTKVQRGFFSIADFPHVKFTGTPTYPSGTGFSLADGHQLNRDQGLNVGIAEGHVVSGTASNGTKYFGYINDTTINSGGDYTITGISVAPSTVITTAADHNTSTGELVFISGSSSTPSIDGLHTATKISDTTFSIPVTVTDSGSPITGNSNRQFKDVVSVNMYTEASIETGSPVQGEWNDSNELLGSDYSIIVPIRVGAGVYLENRLTGTSSRHLVTEISYVWQYGRVQTDFYTLGSRSWVQGGGAFQDEFRGLDYPRGADDAGRLERNSLNAQLDNITWNFTDKDTLGWEAAENNVYGGKILLETGTGEQVKLEDSNTNTLLTALNNTANDLDENKVYMLYYDYKADADQFSIKIATGASSAELDAGNVQYKRESHFIEIARLINNDGDKVKFVKLYGGDNTNGTTTPIVGAPITGSDLTFPLVFPNNGAIHFSNNGSDIGTTSQGLRYLYLDGSGSIRFNNYTTDIGQARTNYGLRYLYMQDGSGLSPAVRFTNSTGTGLFWRWHDFEGTTGVYSGLGISASQYNSTSDGYNIATFWVNSDNSVPYIAMSGHINMNDWQIHSSSGVGTATDSVNNIYALAYHNILMQSGTGTTVVVDGNGKFLKLSSSKRFKENIVDLDLDSSQIYNLMPHAFKWKDTNHTVSNPAFKPYSSEPTTIEQTYIGGEDFGYIAEEVHEILPALVGYEDSEDGDNLPSNVRYDHIAILLVEELKKLRARIEVLEGNNA